MIHRSQFRAKAELPCSRERRAGAVFFHPNEPGL
jgi:hypothetical protein